MKTSITLILCCACVAVSAQYSVNYRRAADTYFQNKEYFTAATFYKKALNITTDSTQIAVPYIGDTDTKAGERRKEDNQFMVYRLAEASRLYKNFKDAEIYYGIAASFKEPAYADAGYWYGASLRANQKFNLAITALQSYIQSNPTSALRKEADLELASARFAYNAVRNPELYQLTKLPAGINDGGSNYAPSATASVFYFTSSRPVTPEGAKKVLQTGDNSPSVTKKATPYLNNLYWANASGKMTASPTATT
ncbi:MAG: hypothetical protein EOP51_28410, partial [Sphingobacteriales bacterium]